MAIENGSHYVQDEIPFHPLVDKDWSHLDHSTAETHIGSLMRQGEAIHGITMPERPTGPLRGVELARAVMNGTVQVENVPSDDEPVVVQTTQRAHYGRQTAPRDLYAVDRIGHIDRALHAAEKRLGRNLTDSEAVHIAAQAERAAENGR